MATLVIMLTIVALVAWAHRIIVDMRSESAVRRSRIASRYNVRRTRSILSLLATIALIVLFVIALIGCSPPGVQPGDYGIGEPTVEEIFQCQDFPGEMIFDPKVNRWYCDPFQP